MRRNYIHYELVGFQTILIPLTKSPGQLTVMNYIPDFSNVVSLFINTNVADTFFFDNVFIYFISYILQQVQFYLFSNVWSLVFIDFLNITFYGWVCDMSINSEYPTLLTNPIQNNEVNKTS